MRMSGVQSARVLAAVNGLFGLITAYGGFQEAIAQARLDIVGPTIPLGILGGVAGLLLVVSGAGLWARRRARRLMLTGAGMSLITHASALWLASPGVVLVIIGVIYPAALLLLLWTRPSLGSGQPAASSLNQPHDDRRPGGHQLRAATASLDARQAWR